jgi:hypothetical protein
MLAAQQTKIRWSLPGIAETWSRSRSPHERIGSFATQMALSLRVVAAIEHLIELSPFGISVSSINGARSVWSL